MHFLLATDSYLPDSNGVAISVNRHREALLKLGHSVEVLGPSRFDLDRSVDTWAILSTLDPSYKAELPLETYSISAAVRAADIIHIHTPFGLGMAVAWQAQRQKKHYAFTHHTNFFDDYMHYLRSWNVGIVRSALKRLYRRLIMSAKVVIAPTEASKKDLLNICPEVTVKTKVLPSFGYPPVTLSNHEYERDTDLIFVGRIAPEKNIVLALQTIIDFGKNFPLESVAIVGDGVYRDTAEKSMRSFRDGYIKFYGNVANRDVRDILLRSSVMLFTSVSDTQALVLDEAAACGVPVVAVNSELTRERIVDGETGWLCESSPGSLSKGLANAFRNLNEKGGFFREACCSSVKYRSLEDWAKDYLSIIGRISV